MRFRHLLTIQTKKDSDEFSEQPPDWEDVREEWFSLTPLSGDEYDRAQQIQSKVTHKAVCHWFDGATSQMRLVKKDEQDEVVRQFNVEAAFNQREQNRFLEWRLIEAM